MEAGVPVLYVMNTQQKRFRDSVSCLVTLEHSQSKFSLPKAGNE